MAAKIDLTKLDLYGLFEVSPDATVQEIKTAYRRKALKVHPDKNPDNKEAAKQFHELSEALKVLTDESAKAAYDRVLKARKEADIRNRKLDAKRRKLKEELEAREKAYATKGKFQDFKEKNPEELLKSEIERLQKQGSQHLAEEQERIREELMKERLQRQSERLSQRASGTLKIKWNFDERTENPYTRDQLYSILNKYGDIAALVVSSKGKGNAMVEFTKRKDAETALSSERGMESCPLILSWMNQPADLESRKQDMKIEPPISTVPSTTQATSLEDYEDRILRLMREAQERKRKLDN